MSIAIIIGIVVIISIGAVIFFKGTASAPKPVPIDVISAETVITFFKRPDVLQEAHRCCVQKRFCKKRSTDYYYPCLF